MTQLPHSRPVRAGCAVLVGLAALAAVTAVALAVFLDSGADSGKVVLDRAAAYAPGSAEFIGSRGFYLVRLTTGEFFALSNLDSGNRASPGRRCPVAPVLPADPDRAGLLQSYRSRISPQAASAALLFRETCRGAIYDAAGVRLDADGPNLDRYAVATRGDGRVVVDVSSRHCSQREGNDAQVPAACRPPSGVP